MIFLIAKVKHRIRQGFAPLDVGFEGGRYGGDNLGVVIRDPDDDRVLHRFDIAATDYQDADLLTNRLASERSRFTTGQAFKETFPEE